MFRACAAAVFSAEGEKGLNSFLRRNRAALPGLQEVETLHELQHETCSKDRHPKADLSLQYQVVGGLPAEIICLYLPVRSCLAVLPLASLSCSEGWHVAAVQDCWLPDRLVRTIQERISPALLRQPLTPLVWPETHCSTVDLTVMMLCRSSFWVGKLRVADARWLFAVRNSRLDLVFLL